MHLTFPDTWDAGFWATAGSDESDCAVFWGDWMEWPSDACSGGADLTRLSFALLGAETNDCNDNGVPDECDIGAQWGGFCEGPDCSTDLDENGLPDECQLCGDFTNDGLVDADDYWVFLAACGRCEGVEEYNAACDLDDDGCVTFVDF